MSSEADDASERFVSNSPDQMSEVGDEPAEADDKVNAREAYSNGPAPNGHGHQARHLPSGTREETHEDESEEDVYEDEEDDEDDLDDMFAIGTAEKKPKKVKKVAVAVGRIVCVTLIIANAWICRNRPCRR